MLWDCHFKTKQSRSSTIRYMARGVFYPIFGCPCTHLLSQLTLNSTREGTIVGRTASGVIDSENTESRLCRNASSLYDSKMSIDTIYEIYCTFPYTFRKMVWLKLPLNCRRWLPRRTTGELSSAWNSDLFMHVRSALVLHEQTRIAATTDQTRLDSGDSQHRG